MKQFTGLLHLGGKEPLVVMGQGMAIPILHWSFSLRHLPPMSSRYGFPVTTRNQAVVAFARQGLMTPRRNRKTARSGQAHYFRMIASVKGDCQTPLLKMVAFH